MFNKIVYDIVSEFVCKIENWNIISFPLHIIIPVN